MPTHLTVRMAWHDNMWDGTICRDPEGNVYCTGTRSLLSERIARNRNLKAETQAGIPGSKIDSVDEYLPPCYWSSNAFGPDVQEISHRHPFWRFKELTIPEKMAPYSTFTWPFRISFNHSEEKVNTEGSYPKDLNKKIEDFTAGNEDSDPVTDQRRTDVPESFADFHTGLEDGHFHIPPGIFEKIHAVVWHIVT